MKALLINPPTGRYMRHDRCQAPVDSRVAEPPRPPMDLAYMAAVLEEIGVECRIGDYPMEGLGWKDVERDLKSFHPDWLIISTTTPTMDHDLTACDLAKEINPQIRTVAKGAHFFIFDTQILENFTSLDIVIRGEPELAIKELVGAKDYLGIKGITFRKGSEIIRNPDRPFLESLDDLPLPARHLINNALYRTPDTDKPIAFINTGRGCASRCVFCAAAMVSGYKIRMRSIDSVIREIEECVKRHGIKDFFFASDTFTWDKQWVIGLCGEILRNNLNIRWGTNSRVDTIDEERLDWMKKAGCHIIGFGAESASQSMLEKMKKNISVSQIENAVTLCKKYGIESFLIFVVGLPWETKDTIEETARFVKNTHASFIEVNVAYPLPGTEFYNIAKENNLFNENDLLGHNYSSPLIRSFTLSTDELNKARKKILEAFYLRPGYIAARLCKLRSPRVAFNYFKYGIRLIKNLLKSDKT